MIPGFEANLIGMREDEERTFTRDVPGGLRRGGAGRPGGRVHGRACSSCASAACRAADDDFAGQVGPYEDLAALRDDLRSRMTRQRPRPRPARLRRPHHRVRHGQRHGRAARPARRARGRDDGRRAEGPHRPAGHPLRGLPARHGEDRGLAARGVPRGRRAPRQGAARARTPSPTRRTSASRTRTVEAEIAHLRAERSGQRRR